MRLRISRLCVFTWRNGQMVCDDPVRHRQMALSSGAQALLHRFGDWTDVPDAGDPDESPGDPDTRLVRQLLAAHILVAEDSPEHRFEEELGPWSRWGTAATYYHLATRTRHDEEFLTSAEDTAWLMDHLPDRPQPREFKEYPDSPRIALSPGDDSLLASSSVEQVLRARRTTRQFAEGAPLTEEQLATVLRWVGGPQHRVHRPGMRPAALKASPSAGAMHALEIYPVVLNVEGVAPGVYHYHSTEHALEPLVPGPLDVERVIEWVGGQTYLRHAGVLLLHTAVLERPAWKYRTGRTYRDLFMEMGHFSQTAYLVGAALGLGVFFTAATRDAAIEEALGLDWRQEVFLGLNGLGVRSAAETARQEAMLAGAEPDFSFAGDAWDGRGA